MANNYYINTIRSMRLRFGESPRKFSPKLNSYMKLVAPAWVTAHKDKINAQYKDYELLLTQGTVVWGTLVMANSGIFEEGTDDLPGVIVYSPDIHRHDDLLRLDDACKKVSALKEGDRKNKEEERLGEWLADELERFLAHPVPKSIAGDEPMLTSCMMFIRKHLPTGILNSGFFPVVVHPDSVAAMLLPSCFWPEDFLQHWESTE